jgi:hypothetical protein
MHGAIARATGLASLGGWIQEALACAVQVRLHPQSMRADLAAAFRRIEAGERGTFVPFAQLFARDRHTPRDYAQLATIAAHLADRHGARLDEAWRAIAAAPSPLQRSTPAAVAGALGMTLEEWEKDWIAWGRERHP